jgi:predicted transposase YbfD/YdcC
MNLPPVCASDRSFFRWWEKACRVVEPVWEGQMPDPRAPRGQRWKIEPLPRAMWLGMLVGARTLRDVEELTKEIAGEGFGIERRVPDSTLTDLIPELDPAPFRGALAEAVRRLHRMKVFESDLPFGIVSIDGKTTAVKEAFNEYCQRQKGGYLLYRVLNATLISSPVAPVVMQIPIERRTNEVGMLRQMVGELGKSYGHSAMFQAVFLDAGFASREHMHWIHHDQHLWFIVRIKDTQRELKAELMRLFKARQQGGAFRWHAEQDWERYRGEEIRRRVWRTDQIAGYLEWPIRQGWVVEVTRRTAPGKEDPPEYRYYVTDIPPGRLSAAQALEVVRAHWLIENGTHWVADVIWKEDEKPWCRQGNALMVLGLPRAMAITVLRWLRCRRPRRDRVDLREGHSRREYAAWRSLLRWIENWLTVMACLHELGRKEVRAGT